MPRKCLMAPMLPLFVALAVGGLSCGKSKKTTDTTTPTATATDTSTDTATSALTAMPDMATGALNLMPNIKDGTALLANSTWKTEDKSTYRNDIAFQVLMRFMDADEAKVLELGNENMRSNITQAKMTAYDIFGYAVGTSSVTGDGHTFTATIQEKDATSATVSPFDFGVEKATGFTKVRKLTVAEQTGVKLYAAQHLVGAKAYLVGANAMIGGASSSEGSGDQYTVVAGDFDNSTKALTLDYASNVDYASGANFIIRMDLAGNTDTKAFEMKMTLRSISKPNAPSGAGGFAIVSKGTASGSDKVIVAKARECLDSTSEPKDAKNCLGTATTKWFCFAADSSLGDFETFVKSGDGHGAGYTNTAKIQMQANYTSFTGSCLEQATAIADTAYIEASEAEVPAANTTYTSTLGYE